MILLLSPSKTLDFESALPEVQPTQPALLDHSKQLADLLKTHSQQDIAKLMKLSDKLSQLNYERFQSFETPFSSQNARPCLFAFKGDVYEGLDVDQFSASQLGHAQQHLRIISGLYGLLRPFDFIQPYRLEMGTKLANKRGKNLYEFWGEIITDELNKALSQSDSDKVVNLASNEYFKAIKPKALKGEIITPIFKERKGNQLKIIAIYAKKARGMMVRHLLAQPKVSLDHMESFNENGYQFDAELSSPTERVFVANRS